MINVQPVIILNMWIKFLKWVKSIFSGKEDTSSKRVNGTIGFLIFAIIVLVVSLKNDPIPNSVLYAIFGLGILSTALLGLVLADKVLDYFIDKNKEK